MQELEDVVVEEPRELRVLLEGDALVQLLVDEGQLGDVAHVALEVGVAQRPHHLGGRVEGVRSTGLGEQDWMNHYYNRVDICPKTTVQIGSLFFAAFFALRNALPTSKIPLQRELT